MRITSNNQLETIIRKAGIKAELQPVPKEFLIALVEKNNNKTISRKFQTKTDYVNTVIQELIEEYLGKKVSYGENSNCTLDYFVEETFKNDEQSAQISGHQLRYTPLSKPKVGGSHNWKYLPETTSLIIYPTVPQFGDTDQETLQKNLVIATKAITETIETEYNNISKLEDRVSELKVLLKKVTD